MSYDLEIFNGDPAAPEESFAPLDSRLAWRVVEELLVQEQTMRDRDELLWFLPTRTVNIFLGGERDMVPTVAAAMVWGNRADPQFDDTVRPNSTPELVRQQKADLTRIFIVLQNLASRLGARVYDPQQGDFLPPESISHFVETFDYSDVVRPYMDYAQQEPVVLRTTDAEQARKAITFSPWLVLGALLLVGAAGLYMTRDGRSIPPPSYVPRMERLNDYEPGHRRNAPPQAEIWVDDDLVVHRGALRNGDGMRGLHWVIRADGQLLEERPADDETSVRIVDMASGVTYTVQLKLYNDTTGKDGRVASEMVTVKRGR